MQFYIREAWILDERRFREWLDLFTEDVFYFMPRRLNVHRHETERELTPVGDLAIFDDDKTYLTMRIERLETGMAWGEDPPSRTRHLVGNLVALIRSPMAKCKRQAPPSSSTARTTRPRKTSSLATGMTCPAARGRRLEDSPPNHRAGLQRHHGQEPQRVLLGHCRHTCALTSVLALSVIPAPFSSFPRRRECSAVGRLCGRPSTETENRATTRVAPTEPPAPRV